MYVKQSEYLSNLGWQVVVDRMGPANIFHIYGAVGIVIFIGNKFLVRVVG